MEEFFHSVGRAFESNRSNSGAAEILLGLLVTAAILAGFGFWLLSLWRTRRQLEERVRDLGLGPDEVRLLRALARAAPSGKGLDPLLLLTHLQEFEATTAAALAASQAGGSSERTLALADRIRRLREALAFDRLSAHVPLLSTRELPAGTAIEVGAHAGVVVGNDELELRALLRAPPPKEGSTLALSLLHGQEARYHLRCTVRAARPDGPERTLLRLRHDEAPERIQDREFARIGARGTVDLRWGIAFVRASGARGMGAELVDLSGGGLQLETGQPLPAGLLVSASFDVASERFAQVPAVVVGCERLAGGRARLRLELRDLPEIERERLISLLQRVDGLVRGRGRQKRTG